MEDSSTAPIPYAPRLWTAKFKVFEDALHDPVPRVRQMNACDWELATESSDGFHVDSIPPCPSQPNMIVPPGRDPPSLEVKIIGLDNTGFLSRQPCVYPAQVSYDATVRPPVTLDPRTPQSEDGFDSGSEPESEDEPGSSGRDRFEAESDAESEDIVECDSEYSESDSDGGDRDVFCEHPGSGAVGSYLQLDSAEESEPDDFCGPAARVDSGEHGMVDRRPQPEGAASFFDGPHPWVCESSVPLPAPTRNATSTTTPGALRVPPLETAATDAALREDASKFITRAEFDAFLTLALPPVNLACPVSDCATKLSHLCFLKRHLETHLAPAEREQHRCRRCGRNLARSDSLRRHLKMKQDCGVVR